MYRKFSADHLFTGYQMLQQQVLITDAAGTVVDIIAENEAGDDVEKMQGILSPGFINAHCHLELSHLKGHIPKHTGLVDFVLKVINERHFEETEILSATEKAELEMQQSGIVAVGDICNNLLTIPQKIKGNIRYHNFIEASGFPPQVAEIRFKRAVDLYTNYAEHFAATSIVPHAPYSVSAELMAMINEFPGNNLLTIHNQETNAENEFFENASGDFLRLYEKLDIDISFFKPRGKTSLQTWLPNFTKDQSIILVHDVCTSEADVDLIKFKIQKSKFKIFLCICPNANLYISNMLPDVPMLMKHTDDIVLGTDSLASNDELSILGEMKTLQINFKQLELPTLLKWATSNGASALQMDDKLGSFEKRKMPGVLLIENIEDMQLKENTIVKRVL